MERRRFIRLAGGSMAAAAIPKPGLAAKAASPPKSDLPNIVVIMTDQQRADYMKIAGFPLDTQPFLDSLARQGTCFPRAYTPEPVCAPARCSLMTGRFPKAHRVRENSGIRNAYFSRDLLDVLQEQGYYTGLIGKNHSYLQKNKFDVWQMYGHWNGVIESKSPPFEKQFEQWVFELTDEISKEPTPFPLEAQHPYRMVTNAIEFLKSAGSRPFFLWLSFPEPHNPYQTPRPYFDMFPPETVPDRVAGPEVLARKGFKWEWQRRLLLHYIPDYEKVWRRVRSNACGMYRLIDDQVRRFVEALQDRKQWDNTIVVFLSDHGDFLGDYGLHKKGVDLPECLVRIPMYWRGPGIQADRIDHPAFVSTTDVMPTLCEAIGVPIPEGVQGRSLWPLLQGKPYPEEEFRSSYAEAGVGGLFYDEGDDLDFDHPKLKRPIKNIFDELNSYSQSGNLKMVRMGDWKLCYDMMGRGQLYDLKSDPAELRDHYGDPAVAETQMRMLKELATWTIRTEDVLPTNAYRHKWPERNWYAPYRKTPKK